MWFLLYVFGRRRRPRRAQPGLAIIGFAAALAGVLIGGLWLGVAFAVVAVLLLAAAA